MTTDPDPIFLVEAQIHPTVIAYFATLTAAVAPTWQRAIRLQIGRNRAIATAANRIFGNAIGGHEGTHDQIDFAAGIAPWPQDVRAHLERLAQGAFGSPAGEQAEP